MSFPSRLRNNPSTQIPRRIKILKFRRQSPAVDVLVIKPRVADHENGSFTVFGDSHNTVAINRQNRTSFTRNRECRHFFNKNLPRCLEDLIPGPDIHPAHLVVIVQDLKLAVLVELDTELASQRVELIEL